MQNVKIQVNQNDWTQYRPYQTNSEYWAPLAMKQHANRLQKFIGVNMTDSDKGWKTPSTYYSNIPWEDINDIEDKNLFDGELIMDNLIVEKEELEKLQKDLQ